MKIAELLDCYWRKPIVGTTSSISTVWWSMMQNRGRTKQWPGWPRLGRGLALALASGLLATLLPAAPGMPAAASTNGDATAAVLSIPAASMAASEFVVTRPGTVLVDVANRRAVLDAMPVESRDALCGAERDNWPTHGVQRNIAGDAQVAQTLALTMMQAGARYLATDDPMARDTIASNLGRFAEEAAFSRLLEPVTVNHFYNLDRTLLPIIANFALIADDPALDAAEVAEIRRWLDRLVRWRGPERRMDPTRQSSRNNHRYLRDSVTMAWGAMVGDNALFFSGIDRFLIALEQMRGDGSLPLETNRGANALFYQRHAISSLVVIAEIAAAQGYDLYALENSDGHGLHHMIRFLADGIDDAAVVEPYAEEGQYLGFLDWRGHDRHYMAWFEPYRARFPDSPLTKRLEAQIRALGTLDQPMLDDYVGVATTCLFADPTSLRQVALD